MSQYLLIESRDPFESADSAHYYELAVSLARAGNKVTMFLVQNGVFTARQSVKSSGLAAVANAGAEVLVDEFSLRERGIAVERLMSKATPAPLDVVIDRLCDGHKVIWH